MHNFPQRAAAGIGRSLDAVSGSWFVIPLDGRVLRIAMHVLVSLVLGIEEFIQGEACPLPSPLDQ
jgi:hypothetical protein